MKRGSFTQIWPRGIAVVMLALLAACSSVDLPPWVWPPPVPKTRAPSEDTQPIVLVPATTMSSIAERAEPGPTNSSSENPAVAAHFPTLTVSYYTPGLQAGQNNYTTHRQLQTWLQELVDIAARSVDMKVSLLNLEPSQDKTPVPVLLLTRARSTDAATLLASVRPTVLLVGQQHDDEPVSAEALLVIARELTQGLLQPLLNQINVIIVPRLNPDNQTDPDVRHDHLLLQTLPAQVLAVLARDYSPAIVVDVGEYDPAAGWRGKWQALAKFDALLQYATPANNPEFLARAAEEWFRRPLIAALAQQGLSSEWYHSTSELGTDLSVSMQGAQADSNRNVYALKNSISFFIASRGVGLGRSYLQRRVHTQVTALTSLLTNAAQRAENLNLLLPYIKREVSAQACKGDVTIEANTTSEPRELPVIDSQTGVERNLTVDWRSALVLQKTKVRAHACGYWLSASSQTAVQRLRLHGVQIMRVLEPGTFLSDLYQPLENANPMEPVKVDLVRGTVSAPAGSYYIPLNQPLAYLVVAALEPDTRESFFSQGLIDKLPNLARVMGEQPDLKLEPLP